MANSATEFTNLSYSFHFAVCALVMIVANVNRSKHHNVAGVTAVTVAVRTQPGGGKKKRKTKEKQTNGREKRKR